MSVETGVPPTRRSYDELEAVNKGRSPEERANSGADRARARDSSEEWRERARWTPTSEQFHAYLAREVEMARDNLSRPGATAGSMLHSSSTIQLAQEAIEKEKP